jgi:hypothetical protein
MVCSFEFESRVIAQEWLVAYCRRLQSAALRLLR